MNQNINDIVIKDLPSYKVFKKTSYFGSLGLIPCVIFTVVGLFFSAILMLAAISDKNLLLGLISLLFLALPIIALVALTSKWRKIESNSLKYQYLGRVVDMRKALTGNVQPSYENRRNINSNYLYFATVNTTEGQVEATVGQHIYEMLEPGDEVVVFSTNNSSIWALPLHKPE